MLPSLQHRAWSSNPGLPFAPYPTHSVHSTPDAWRCVLLPFPNYHRNCEVPFVLWFAYHLFPHPHPLPFILLPILVFCHTFQFSFNCFFFLAYCLWSILWLSSSLLVRFFFVCFAGRSQRYSFVIFIIKMLLDLITIYVHSHWMNMTVYWIYFS